MSLSGIVLVGCWVNWTVGGPAHEERYVKARGAGGLARSGQKDTSGTVLERTLPPRADDRQTARQGSSSGELCCRSVQPR